MPKRYARRHLRKRSRRAATRKGRGARTGGGIKRLINRTISRNIETKFATANMNITNYNSSIRNSEYLAVLPAIPFGTGQAQRLGHSIRPTRLVVQGYIAYSTPSTATNNKPARLLHARLMMFQDKSNKSYNNGVANDFLLGPGGVSQNFNGSPEHINWPLNKDQFIFYKDRKFKILKPYGFTNTTTAADAMTSTDASLFQPFRIVLGRKQLPAVLRYDTNDGADYPTNFAPYLALGYADVLGFAADTTTTQLSMAAYATFYYKDA